MALSLSACENRVQKAQEQAALAQQLLDAGDLVGAQGAINTALSYKDDEVAYLMLNGRIKLRANDLLGARDAFKSALVFEPNEQEALTALVRIASLYGDRADLREYVPRALALDPTNGDVLLFYGMSAIKDGKYDEALKAAETILKNPADPRGVVLKSRALFEQGDKAASYALLKNFAATQGNNDLVAISLLENARAEGDVPGMLEQYAFLAANNAQSSDLALDEINTRYKSGDAASARALGVAYLKRFSNGTPMRQLFDLWKEYDRTPLDGAAIAELANDASIDVRLAVVRYLIDNGDLESGVPLLANAPDPRIYAMMSRLKALRGEPAGYVEANAILQRDDANCEALTTAAEWLIGHGDTAKGIVPAQKLATQCRDRTDGYNLMVRAYEHTNRPIAVERAYRDGIEISPTDIALARDFSNWLLARKRASAALSVARRLTVLAPSRISSWQLYDDVCTKVGDRSCAAAARKGIDVARRTYLVDPLPGAKKKDDFFGRTWR